jgi:hypothetical protein
MWGVTVRGTRVARNQSQQQASNRAFPRPPSYHMFHTGTRDENPLPPHSLLAGPGPAKCTGATLQAPPPLVAIHTHRLDVNPKPWCLKHKRRDIEIRMQRVTHLASQASGVI